MPLHDGSREAHLDALLRAYAEACPAPEPSANFMPQLWQRIEARQRYSFFFGRIARGFVTAAVAVTLAMAVYLSMPRTRTSAFYSGTYIDALAASHPADASDLYDSVHDTGELPDQL